MTTESSTGETWSDEWRRYYGRHYAVLLALLALLLFIRGVLEPLSDADLPMHLALGEWIVNHREVPSVEPFAWTRPGSPFYAYSWAMDVLLYAVAQVGGKAGLRVLNGLIAAGAFASMLALGRAARWNPRTSLLMAFLNVTVLSIVTAPVRPQALLFIFVPLAWAFTYQALGELRPRGALFGLVAVGALAANTHIFFPLTAIPALLLIAEPSRRKWRISAIIAATVAGWFLSPYADMWPEIFRLNAEANALLVPPSPINEAQPGFVDMRYRWPAIPIALFLASLPWISRAEIQSRASRILLGGAWLFGLVAFGSAFRLLLLWWLLVLPLVASALERIAAYLLATEEQAVRLWRMTAVWAVCLVFILSTDPFDARVWRFEDPIGTRRLPLMKENGIDQLAHWLQCNTRPDANGRVFTDFNFGSALTWRLPGYSMSVDGRTIFPDSVAKAEAFYDPFRVPLRLGPWRSADLAIMPVPSGIADVLDRADGWRRVAVAHNADASTALWVTNAWWSRAGSSPLPQRPVSLMPGDAPDPTGSCRSLPPS